MSERNNAVPDAIRSVFVQSPTQICVIHQIKNYCKYVVYKGKKEFTADIKSIYNAPNKEVATIELDNQEKKWAETIYSQKDNNELLLQSIFKSWIQTIYIRSFTHQYNY